MNTFLHKHTDINNCVNKRKGNKYTAAILARSLQLTASPGVGRQHPNLHVWRRRPDLTHPETGDERRRKKMAGPGCSNHIMICVCHHLHSGVCLSPEQRCVCVCEMTGQGWSRSSRGRPTLSFYSPTFVAPNCLDYVLIEHPKRGTSIKEVLRCWAGRSCIIFLTLVYGSV